MLIVGFSEQGKETNKGRKINEQAETNKGRKTMMPQMNTLYSDTHIPSVIMRMSSGLIGVYLRFYQLTFNLIRFLQ